MKKIDIGDRNVECRMWTSWQTCPFLYDARQVGNTNRQEQIDRVVELAKAYGATRLILFGSAATQNRHKLREEVAIELEAMLWLSISMGTGG